MDNWITKIEMDENSVMMSNTITGRLDTEINYTMSIGQDHFRECGFSYFSTTG